MTKAITILFILSLTTIFGQFGVKEKPIETEQIIKPKTYNGQRNIDSDIIFEQENERKKYIGEEFSFAPEEVYKPMIFAKYPNSKAVILYQSDSISKNKYVITNFLTKLEFKELAQSKYLDYDYHFNIVEIKSNSEKDVRLFVTNNIFGKYVISTKYQRHLENEMLGNTFIHMHSTAPRYQDKFYIIEKEDFVPVKNYSEWKVKEIKYMETTQGSTTQMSLAILLNNPEYGTTYRVWRTEWSGLSRESKRNGRWFIPKEEYLIKIKKDQDAIKQNKIRLAKIDKENEEEEERVIKKYGARIGALINSNKLEVGMTEEMCLKSWGTPFEKKNLENEYGTLTLWNYYHGYKVYFLNGKITQFEY